MKKISFLLPSFDYGGAEKNMIMLANLFQQKGHSIDILVIKDKGELKKSINSKINIINFNYNRSIYCIFKLIKYFNKSSSLYHFSSISHLNIISIFCSFFIKNKINIIIRESNVLFKCFTIKEEIKKIIIFHLSKYCYKKSYKIIAISDAVENYLIKDLKINNHKIIKINNPINIDDIKEKCNKKISHKFFNESRKVILTVSSLTKQKNISLLLHSFANVITEINANLLIIGKGSEYKNLKKIVEQLKIDERVEFLGNINNPYPYMQKCDLFVLSSYYEGLPNVLIEALACHSHIIATDCPGGSSEILKNYGTLSKCNDENDLTNKIISFFKQNTNKSNINRRYFDYSIDKQFSKYENIINEN